jgi:hypothetical protein
MKSGETKTLKPQRDSRVFARTYAKYLLLTVRSIFCLMRSTFCVSAIYVSLQICRDELQLCRDKEKRLSNALNDTVKRYL